MLTPLNQSTTLQTATFTATAAPQPLGSPLWDWSRVRRILVVRLRSIGDTVLATSPLHALKRFVPEARTDVLLEDWVAPVLSDSKDVDRVITVKRGSKRSRLSVARELHAAGYDVAFNLHGGSTATLLTLASGATHRVGYRSYRYSPLHNHLAPPPAELWGRPRMHSVEQQLALLGWTGVPVSDCPPTRLPITEEARQSIAAKLARYSQLSTSNRDQPFALLHPVAAFATKQWDTENFARIAEQLAERGLTAVAVATPGETEVLQMLKQSARVPIASFTDLTLPEIIALAAQARFFVGNDSGIAHIAHAVNTPSVVVFGSSNVWHWRPWTLAPAEVVREEMPCAPCPGYTCNEFAEPECIRRVKVERVAAAIDRILRSSTSGPSNNIDVDTPAASTS